jgi:hypothetical protein
VKEQGKVTIGLTRYETGLTWLFTAVYLLFGLGILVALILQLTSNGLKL